MVDVLVDEVASGVNKEQQDSPRGAQLLRIQVVENRRFRASI
jgi:hypothetical protein